MATNRELFEANRDPRVRELAAAANAARVALVAALGTGLLTEAQEDAAGAAVATLYAAVAQARAAVIAEKVARAN